MKVETIPQMLRNTVQKHPKYTAQCYKDEKKNFIPITYEELYAKTLNFASGLMTVGCKPGDKIGIIMGNRPEWFVCAIGAAAARLVDVPRGTDSTVGDLEYILSLADCKIVIAETETALDKILQVKAKCPLLKKIIIVNRLDSLPKTDDIEFFYYEDLLELGKKDFEKNAPEEELLKGKGEDLATIIFTSGTTGLPKGVMLTQKNFVAQFPELKKIILLEPGRTAISVLPIWHSFAREVEFFVLSDAGCLYYSSPIASILMPDIQKSNPYLFPSVPRVWEAVYDAIFKMMKKEGGIKYKIFQFAVAVGTFWKEQELKLKGQWLKLKKSEKITQPLFAFLPTVLLFPLYALADLLVFKKIRSKLGTNFKYGGGVSGGAALPHNIDMFFAAAKIMLVEGYGLTETAPIIACRDMNKPIFGTVGKPLACLKAKIMDENGNELPAGQEGEIWIKGETVMAGYYKNEQATKAAITEDGWFKTGDLGLMTIEGDLVLRGRVKDTIVLLGGENIEPVPIELKLQESMFISTAVVVGQDERNLGALLVVDEVSLTQWLKENKINYTNLEAALVLPEVQNLYASEIRNLISTKTGFKIFEKIAQFKLLHRKFEVGKELSIKMEIRRNKISQFYEKEIKELFGR